MFELLSKAVVESKQKVNIPKLSKEEPGEKEESEKAKREEERGVGLSNSIFISFQMHNVFLKKFISNGWDHKTSIPSLRGMNIKLRSQTPVVHLTVILKAHVTIFKYKWKYVCFAWQRSKNAEVTGQLNEGWPLLPTL